MRSLAGLGLAVLAMCLLGAIPARAASLELTLAGMPGTGTLYVMVTRDPVAFAGHVCADNGAPDYFTWCGTRVIAGDGRDEVITIDLSNGLYAIKAFVDENNNRKLDIGVLGPDEPTAFGNDARAFFGPPSFQDSAIAINGTTFHRVTLKE